MMQRAIQVRMIPVITLWLGILVPAMAAGERSLDPRNPAVGYAVAARAAKGEGGSAAQLATFLRKGAEAYEKAAFSAAVDWFDNARALAPNQEEISELLNLAVEKRNRQRAAQKDLPAGKAEREAYLQKAYADGIALKEKGDLAAAHEAFAKVWLVAGKFEDVTKLMAETSAQPAAAAEPAPVASEPVPVATESAPASAAEGASNDAKSRIDALIVSGQIEAQAGRTESARKIFKQALELDPKNKVVQWNLGKLPAEPKVVETAKAVAPVQAAPAPEAKAEPAVAAKAEPASAPETTVSEAAAADAAERAEAAGKNAADLLAAESARKIEELSIQAEAALEHKNFDLAEKSYLAVLDLDGENRAAIDGVKQIARARAAESRKVAATKTADLQPIDAAETKKIGGDRPSDPPPPVREFAQADAPAADAAEPPPPPAPAPAMVGLSDKDKAIELDRMQREAMALYRAGNIEEARKIWEAMLAANPGDKRATTYLDETKAEYERALGDAKAREEAAARSRAAQELLNSPVTISTDRPTPLSEFMRIISFSTASEIEYYIADGAEADIFVNVVDKPLRDVLDTVLTPIGLVWSIDEKNLITIKPEFFPRTYKLSTDKMNKISSLIDSGDLQRVIWGQSEPPAKGVQMTLDERQRVLLAVGSKLHIQKLDDFMATLETAETPDLETQIYKIRADDGPRIKALIGALITSTESTPFNQERKVFIDDNDLIIRDTPENIVKIEELLLDEKFIENLRDQKLDIQNFSLVPRDVESQSVSDQVSVFTTRIVESIETFLYARTGKTAAQAEGRRLWFDPSTLQLTVVDTPANIQAVGQFIESLPELRQKKLQKVITLEHQVAEDMATELNELLGITETTGTGGKGNQTIKKLRRGDDFKFRDLQIRLMRVEEGDPNDRNDDECELQVNTGTAVQNITLRELDTQIFEDYQLTAEDIQPAGGSGGLGGAVNTSNRGEGTVRIMIQYIEPIETTVPGAPTAADAFVAAEAAQRARQEEEGLTISPFGALNFLIVRYDNPARLQEVEDLVKQLDKPTKQVEVETKFVQVNETRAREFSADFNLEGLTNKNGIEKVFNGDYQLNSRFAQVRDELRDNLEPAIESPLAANLLRGTTVLDMVLGGGSVPSLGFQLRLLESEGIINIVNGPKVTMLDAVEGQFRIERIGPATRFSPGQTISGGTSQLVNNQAQRDSLVNEDGARFQNRLTSVILEVTPEITSEKSIIFEIIGELLDFDNNEAVPVYLSVPTEGEFPSWIDPEAGRESLVSGLTGISTGTTGSPFAYDLLNTNNLYRTRKLIDTTARTHDGGTIVLGGWTGERAQELTSGVPVLRNMPYIGKLFFSRNQKSVDRVTLLIFMTANLID